MNYKGRITFPILILVTSFLENMIFYLKFGHLMGTFEVVDVIFYLPIAYFIGLQYDKAKFYSEKDYLTGLYNRRFIEAIFPKLRAQVERNEKNLYLFVIDLDNFKSINDTFGHKKGDEVLKWVSDILSHIFRKEDFISRWGGDEFLLITQSKGDHNPDIIIHRFHEHLERLSEEKRMDISASVGWTIYQKNNSLEELIQTADRNMYMLKNED